MYDIIIEVLELIKKECISHTDDEADEDEFPDVCSTCPYFDGAFCIFKKSVYGGIPEEWNLNSLREKLEKENKL